MGQDNEISMRKPWAKLDLQGAGLQRLNMQLARQMKRRDRAYAYWLTFFIGVHRFYLRSPIVGMLYPIATLGLSLTSGAFDIFWPWLLYLAAMLADLWWIDRRVTALNKQIRMQAYLGQEQEPPPGFVGREFIDNNDATAAPSFQQQEALLRQMHKQGLIGKKSSARDSRDDR